MTRHVGFVRIQHAVDLLPRLDRLLVVRHVRHRAPGAQVRQHHRHAVLGEDVGGLGHEVHAAEDHVLRVVLAHLLGGQLAELEAVAQKVRVLDNFVGLVVVPQDDQVRAEFLLPLRDRGVQLFVRHRVIFIRNRGVGVLPV